RDIILDLRRGVAFSDACKKRAKPLDELEEAFFAYAKERAAAYGKDMDWTFPEDGFGEMDVEALQTWLAEHPNNYWGLQSLARRLQEGGFHDEAKVTLTKLVEVFPEQVDGNSAYRQLAAIYQKEGK